MSIQAGTRISLDERILVQVQVVSVPSAGAVEEERVAAEAMLLEAAEAAVHAGVRDPSPTLNQLRP